MLDSILPLSSGLEKGNYPKFTLTLSPVDKASLVPGVSCSMLSDRLGWGIAWAGREPGHGPGSRTLRQCHLCGCVHTRLGTGRSMGSSAKALWGLLDLLALQLPTVLIARVLLWDWGRQDIKQQIVHPACPEGSEVMVCAPCLPMFGEAFLLKALWVSLAAALVQLF